MAHDESFADTPMLPAIRHMDHPTDLPFDIDCNSVKQMLDDEVDFLLLDCRTPSEHATVHFPAAHLIPMQELPERLQELLPYRHRRIVVHCHLGGRSHQVTDWLRQQGFSKAQNMTGGIDAWAQQIDSSLPRY